MVVLAFLVLVLPAAHAGALESLDGAHFFEGFGDDWLSRWTVSKDAEFTGEWKHEAYAEPEGLPGDKGIVVGNEARKHAVSTVFSESFDPKGKGLVVQYELHTKKAIQCGGAYIKLLSASDALSADGFTNASPYTIMFGPDKCGSTNKVHFILRHKSPKTGEWEEKHLKSTPYPSMTEGSTHLYTAIVGTDNSVKILVDNKESKSVSLLKEGDFEPNVNPPAKIDDPADSKPSDWVDRAKIDDPDASKPDDWDEDAPSMIADPKAEKPAEWLDDAPLQVPDPEGTPPADWDEEEDGEWEAPLVDNPACKPPGGCGEWAAPQISNPDYKGKWHAPMIDNPAYKGEWKAAQIDNPGYFYDEQPHEMAPIGGIGIELWTMQDGALFDNVVVTSDVAVAKEAAKAFEEREEGVKKAKEEPEEEADEKKDEL
jgi:calnexin